MYEKTGFGGVFGLSFAVLVIDFTLRLLLIEKKTAAKYEPGENTDSGSVRSDRENLQSDEEEDEREDEHEPLITKSEHDAYKLEADPPRWMRAFPIFLCLKDVRLLVAILVSFMQATLLAIFDATVPVEAQALYGFDSLRAGLLFIAIVLPYLLLGPIAGWTVDRYGPKPAATLGFGFLTVVLTLLRLVHAGGKTQIIQYCALLTLCGLGLALIGSPSIVEAAAVVERYHHANPQLFGENGPYAQLYGLSSMVFSLGMAVGPLLGGGLRDRIGYGNMNLVAAIMCLGTAILTFAFMGGKPRLFSRRKD